MSQETLVLPAVKPAISALTPQQAKDAKIKKLKFWQNTIFCTIIIVATIMVTLYFTS